MKVSEQCSIAVSKGNQILGLIRRNITYKENEPVCKEIATAHSEYSRQNTEEQLK